MTFSQMPLEAYLMNPRLVLMAVAFFAAAMLQAEELKITTWNLKWFPGGKDNQSEEKAEQHIAAVAKVLKSIDPDILLLQEVKGMESVSALADKLDTGLKVITVSRFPASFSGDADGIDDQQVAILAKKDAVATYRREFERDGRTDPPRGFIFAAFEVDDKYLGVYSVHLKSNLGKAEDNFRKRESSARTIIDHAEGVQVKDPQDGRRWIDFEGLIIGGDFNTEIPGDVENRKDELTMKQIELYGFINAFGDRPLNDRITHPKDGNFPATTFDHIFYRGIEQLGEADITEVKKTVSDHYPVTVIFDVN